MENEQWRSQLQDLIPGFTGEATRRGRHCKSITGRLRFFVWQVAEPPVENASSARRATSVDVTEALIDGSRSNTGGHESNQ